MATGLYDVLTEQELRAILRAQAEKPSKRKDQQWINATELLEGDQLDQTNQALRDRYPERQKESFGDRMQTFTLPLTERYVAEAANAYNKPVIRELVNENDEVDEESTSIMQDAYEPLGEPLHALERRTVLLDTSCLWPQARRGAVTAQVITPQRTHPVLPLDSLNCNAADQRDYMGHVVELERLGEAIDSKRFFVFITAAAHYYYESEDWSEPSVYDPWPNKGFTWPQAEDTKDYKEKITTLPLQMLTYWHRTYPVGKLIPPTDVSIATMNLELNVQWSALLDVLRKQGFGQYIMNLINPHKPPNKIAIGAGTAIALGPGESLTSIGHANDYTGMVGALKSLAKFFAILLRQSPNDFAIDAQGPQSGFAKLVDSLPKIEARQERIKRLKAMEEQYLWPRVGSILVYLGKLPEAAKKLRMRVKFSDVTFPKTIDEQIKEEDQEIKLGLTTAAKILMKRDGITMEEAEAQIEENKAKKPQEPKEEGEGQPPQQKPHQDLVSKLVASRQGIGIQQPGKKKEEKEKDEDEKRPTR
jgi:hypothetical protein